MNFGATCYANATLQALLHTGGLAERLLSTEFHLPETCESETHDNNPRLLMPTSGCKGPRDEADEFCLTCNIGELALDFFGTRSRTAKETHTDLLRILIHVPGRSGDVSIPPLIVR